MYGLRQGNAPHRWRRALPFLLILACCLPETTSAQNTRRNTYRILISEVDNVCRYTLTYKDDAGTVVTPADQQAFVVSPRSRLFFKTDASGIGGAEVRIDAAADGTSGTDGTATVTLGPNERAKLFARKHGTADDQGVDTAHRVNIACCSGTSFFGSCENPVPAGCTRRDDGTYDCPEAEVINRKVGGPEMEVDEDP